MVPTGFEPVYNFDYDFTLILEIFNDFPKVNNGYDQNMQVKTRCVLEFQSKRREELVILRVTLSGEIWRGYEKLLALME